MASGYDEGFAQAPARQSRGLVGLLLIALVAFLLGVIAAGWTVRHWDVAARYLVPPPAARPVRIVRQAVLVPRTAFAPAPAPQPELAEQVDAIGVKLDQVDRRARAAVGDADRAEGLLVAFSARRAIERGVALGYLEGLIREHFAASQPQAVATVLSAARQPVALVQLQAGLKEAEPALVRGGESAGNWAAIRRELSNLIVLRRADTASAAPMDRFARATAALQAGQVDQALAEVSRLPGRTAAGAWIAQARRYLAVRTALDQLETAALIDPARPAA